MDVNSGTSSAAIKRKHGRPSRSRSHANNPYYSAITTGGSASFAEHRRKLRGVSNSSWPRALFSTAPAGPSHAVVMFRVLVEPPPSGVFFSGSEVRGCVHVTTEEEKKFKYIHVSLTGRAQVRSDLSLADPCIIITSYYSSWIA